MSVIFLFMKKTLIYPCVHGHASRPPVNIYSCTRYLLIHVTHVQNNFIIPLPKYCYIMYYVYTRMLPGYVYTSMLTGPPVHWHHHVCYVFAWMHSEEGRRWGRPAYTPHSTARQTECCTTRSYFLTICTEYAWKYKLLCFKTRLKDV